jgi:DNA-binding CsgD family transcriptional regulator
MAQTLTTPTSKASGSSLPLLRMDQKVLERLTNQQRQVLAGLVDGKSTQRIATDLGIPPNVARTEVARIQEITEELFGPSPSQTSDRNADLVYELPTNPVELASKLKNLLASETTNVSNALTLALQDRLAETLTSWFGPTTSFYDISLTKKLANSVASSGESGMARTNEALDLITGWNTLPSGLTKAKAVQILKNETADFRTARSYLTNQAKFINAFLKFYLENNDEFSKNESPILEGSVESNSEFRAWSIALSDAWKRNGKITEKKNHKMYQSHWLRFTEILMSKGINDYSLELTNNVQNYLENESDKQFFLQNLSKATVVNRNVGVAKPSLQTTYKTEGDRTAIHASAEVAPEKLQQMQADVIFLSAQDKLLQKLGLEVSISDEMLVVRFTFPKDLINNRRAIDAINKNIKQAFDQK